MNTPNQLAPSSPQARPKPGGDHRIDLAPLAPPSPRGEVELEPKNEHPQTNTSPHQNGATWNPGTRWLTTPRTALEAALDAVEATR